MTTTPPPSAVPTISANAEDGRRFVRLTRLFKTGGRLWAEVDFLRLFTGEDARLEAARRNDEAPSDYYIVDDDPRLRTFEVRPDAPVSLAIADPTDVERMTAAGLYDRSRSDPGIVGRWTFFLDIRDGTVVAIENFWTP